ncbi:MAG: response regulator transcription factor [Rhodothermaceae bacterium]|nr:response regulator transcription factor [Rhodothermaceae bacterium]
MSNPVHTVEEDIIVSIIEDHKGLRDGMRWMLESTDGFICNGSYGSIEDALAYWEENTPPIDNQIVLMDIGLPGMQGTEGARVVKDLYPYVQIVMLTMKEETDIILQAITAGAVGYLLKSTPPQEILQAIKTVNSGGSSLSGPVALRILQQIQSKQKQDPQQEFNLSERETEILHGLVNGLTYKMLAEELFISIDTVRSHIKKLYEKLHVHSRSEAVAIAVNHGIRPDNNS